jgi:mannonate dehydratase
LRNVIKTDDGVLVESGHVEGDADLVGVMDILLREKKERKARGEIGAKECLPMRSDHGHLMLSDIGQEGVLPGHSVIGRLRGLAEIRGVQTVLEKDSFKE